MTTYGITETCPVCDEDTLVITLRWDPYVPKGQRSPEEGGVFQVVDWDRSCLCGITEEFLRELVDSVAAAFIPEDRGFDWQAEDEDSLLDDWDPDEIPDEESVDG